MLLVSVAGMTPVEFDRSRQSVRLGPQLSFKLRVGLLEDGRVALTGFDNRVHQSAVTANELGELLAGN